MNATARRRHSNGFTLIELLISVTLLALTLGIAFAGLRLAGRSIERAEVTVEEMETLRLMGTVIQRLLAQARPLRGDASHRQALFRGEPDAIEFVAPMPSQEGRLAGMYHYRLRFDGGTDAMQLLLQYQPYTANGQVVWDEERDSMVLADGLSGGGFSFFGRAQREAENAWIARWPADGTLPQLVRVRLERGAGHEAWPELVVPLHARRLP